MTEETSLAEGNGFHVDAVSKEGMTTLRLTGELDIGGTQELSAHVAEALEGKPEKLCIDVSALSFIDSSGIHELVRTVKGAQERGAAFGIQGAHGEVRRLFELSGVSEFFDNA